MGGSHSSSCFSFSRSQQDDDEWEPRYTSGTKVRPSDEDRGRWVGEPDVDRKASAFIAKFHESRFMELQKQTVQAAV